MNEVNIIQENLKDSNLSKSILDIKEYPLPKPYLGKNDIKAFVLGADPSNFSDNGKTRKIEYVFDIGRDKRYFSGINQNLIQLGLTVENVYVQNIVRHYMDKVTQSNSKWNLFADKWLPYIKEEFDSIDINRRMPVLVTAGIILKYLAIDGFVFSEPKLYYNGKVKIPVAPPENKLGRNLIPFYRHWEYSLKKQVGYRDKIISIIANI